ncbi:DUF3320 domain-containing protein [Streptomyces sp. RB6PN25]|uniref:DUF3320 domain-containing protein n=1 Tax=Streptomyces humicola TaxID=2953240 RepID=A0ABT1PST4_9ACTN|nr:DUF3320 domain-containing protein [Streptomyces humicola]MCQ4080742.1 DUF3320 domain-containing protein [Streptomyces humicola]
MISQDTAGGGSDDLDRFKAVLAGWRTSLVDLSGRNRLLNFRHTKSSTLEIIRPGAADLVSALNERPWPFAPLPESNDGQQAGDADADTPSAVVDGEDDAGIVTQKTTAPALMRALRSLRSRSIQIFNDYGLWTLQLGVGMLNWREDGATSSSEAPLILFPVELERTKTGQFLLRASDDEEPRINPALGIKLEQFGIDWTEAAQSDPNDVPAVLDLVRRTVAGKPLWEVTDRLVVSLFAAHKEAMYKDLLDNADAVLASDLVRAIAVGPGGALASDRFDFEEIPLDRIDELSPPEEVPLVLDADASQRQAVAAAVAGKSFVLDGPPGTGKSQTITNIIAGLMHAGRSVLFVSEKAAALDVVLQRLRSVGLDSYALALHSHNTSRKAVAQELGRALTEEPQAPELPEQERRQAQDDRIALSAYSTAMNEVRQPLGRTLHDVIGRIAKLRDAPVAYLAPAAPGQDDGYRPERLAGSDLQAIVQAAQTIRDAWQAVADPAFPWRHLRRGLPHPSTALDQARTALDALTAAVEPYQQLSTTGTGFGDVPAVQRLTQLLGLVARRPGTPKWWLTARDMAEQVDGPVEAFLRRLRRLRRARDDARDVAGARWEEISVRLTAEPPDAERQLARLDPPGLDLTALTEEQAEDMAREFQRLTEVLSRTAPSVQELAQQLGAYAPRSIQGVRALCELAALAEAGHRPVEAWLVPDALEEVRRAAVECVATALDDFLERLARTTAARELAEAEAGPGWAELPDTLAADPMSAERALSALEPPGVDLLVLTRHAAEGLATRFTHLADVLDGARDTGDEAAARLGCPRPVTIAEVRALATLIGLAAAEHRALPRWLDPELLPQVHAAVEELQAAARAVEAAEAAARDTFGPATPHTEELPEAVRRLTGNGGRFAAVLSSQVRADRKLVGGLSTMGGWRAGLQDQLPLALDWHEACQTLIRAVRTHRPLLGHYVADERPDMSVLTSALDHAEAIHRLASEAVADPRRREQLAECLALGGTAPPDLLAQGERLTESADAWSHALDDAPLSDVRAELTKKALTDCARWLRAHLVPLDDATHLIDTVKSIGGRPFPADTGHTLASARAAISTAQAAQRESTAFTEREKTDRALLAEWYQGLDTVPGLVGVGEAGDPRAGELLRDARALRASRDWQGPDASPRELSKPGLLGPYGTDGRADTAALASALDTAAAVHRFARDQLADPARRTPLISALALGGPTRTELLRPVPRIREVCDTWEIHTRQPHLSAVGSQLAAHAFEDCARWLRAHLEPLEDTAALIHAVARTVDAVAPATGWLTLTAARSAVAAVTAARAAQDDFLSHDQQDQQLLGALYDGIATDRDAVQTALDWAHEVRRTANDGISTPLSDTAARIMTTVEPDASVSRRIDEWQRGIDALADYFELTRAREIREELASSLTSARGLLDRMADDPHGPDAWNSATEGLEVVRRYGLEGLPEQLADRGIPAQRFPGSLERAVLQAWVEQQLAEDRRLRPLRAAERDQLVERFRRLDRGLVQAAHAGVIAACNQRRPRRTTVGPAAVLSRQAKLQRRHMPVRKLLSETREVVQLIKPCFMMSPLTVSQFLPSDFLFDVVIFDEASQVLPQDAVNSIYRGNALIVAGDRRQLPPTSFFSAGSDADDDDDWDEDAADSFESILDACKASGVLRELPLRWHYRSRHENLIAFSNHEFYDESMTIFPGAFVRGNSVGVEFFKADGVYDRSNRRDNPREAELVAERVIHHFSTRSKLTLGVVALSRAQAEAIEDAVAKARAQRPDLDRYFTEDRLGGFFVKNLETVQGDERDVIILSIGYGPDAQGKLYAHFGPINREAGGRRLNVAVTRARFRMEVVASFHGGDLPDSPNKSVQNLKRYLQYAERGPAILQTAAALPDAAPESPFEEEVLDALRRWGYDVQPQVGVAGFRIDLGIRHPGAPGSYAIGIECDGAMYHSSKVARDRDRLREEILRGLGWKLHRIWGTDWYRNRKDAERQLREAVETACAADPYAEVAQVRLDEPPLQRGNEVPSVEIVPVTEADRSGWSAPYHALDSAQLRKLREVFSEALGRPDIDIRDWDARRAVAEVAHHIMVAEGPVEEELLIARVREAWGLDRAGQVVQDRIRNALDLLQRSGRATRDGTTWDLPDRPVTVARTPSEQFDRKKVSQVPSVERKIALLGILSESPGLRREELLRETARYFGWLRLGSDIKAALDADIDVLLQQGAVKETPTGLVPSTDPNDTKHRR